MPNHGKGGRPRKPDEVKRLQGTLRKHRITPNQPVFTGTAKLPVWLQGHAREEWKRVAPQLRALGMLTAVDLAMFAAYCQAFGDYIDLTVRLGNLEVTTMTTEDVKERVAAQVHARSVATQRRQAYQQMRECAREFGFTPTSRSTLRLIAEAVPTDDEDAPPTDSLGRSITLMQ